VSVHPYECLHVPVKVARTRVFGLPLWLLWIAVAGVAFKLYGPWLFLAPLLALLAIAAAVAVILAVRARRSPTARVEASNGSTGAETLVAAAPSLTVCGALPGAVSAVTALPCMGCGTDPATSVLEVAGYRIPVCGPCRTIAEPRIGTLPAIPAAVAGHAGAARWRALG
jgi:hypothetical protein